MSHGEYFLARFNEKTSFCEKVFSSANGQALVGVHTIDILKVHVKRRTSDVSESVSFHCDAVMSYQVDSKGIVEKIFTPLDLFNLKISQTHKEDIFSVNKINFRISDVNRLKFWCQSMKTFAKVDIEIDVHCQCVFKC